MADNDDIKDRMKAALDAKNKKASSSTPHGTAPVEGKTAEHADRMAAMAEAFKKAAGQR